MFYPSDAVSCERAAELAGKTGLSNLTVPSFHLAANLYRESNKGTLRFRESSNITSSSGRVGERNLPLQVRFANLSDK